MPSSREREARRREHEAEANKDMRQMAAVLRIVADALEHTWTPKGAAARLQRAADTLDKVIR